MTIEGALRDVFQLAALRPGQREVIESVLAGRPTLAVMPTGAGKSLTYQLPAVVAGGAAIVVSPLVALMKDQVEALRGRGVAAAAITSALDPAEMVARLRELEAGAFTTVYVAPERFRSPSFMAVLARLAPRLSLFAVDEAHCVSQWGHDYRPDYLRLGSAIARLRPARLLAVTATATPRVRQDIIQKLGMENPVVVVRGFDRPNLRFLVEEIDRARGKLPRILSLVTERRRDGVALVYAATRRRAETYAAHLINGGIRAAVYHAGLDADERDRVQDGFMAGRFDVVVATSAFGMGIDKADVRVVVHADMPRTLDAYYQECGRAGRDGMPADAVLLFHWRDVDLQNYLIDASLPSPERMRAIWRTLRDHPSLGTDRRRIARAAGVRADASLHAAVAYLVRFDYLTERDGVILATQPADGEAVLAARMDIDAIEERAHLERQKLDAMIAYVHKAACRRRFLLEYFGDTGVSATAAPCSGCDLCLGDRPLMPKESMRVRVVLAVIERLAGRCDQATVAANLARLGERSQVLPEVTGGGRLGALGAPYCRTLLDALEKAGLVAMLLGDHPVVTDAGRQVLAGTEPRGLVLPTEPRPKRRRRQVQVPAPVPSNSAPDPETVDRLRKFRREVAERTRVPEVFVLSAKSIEVLARRRPRDLAALAAVPGIGPAKLRRYGRDLLRLIADASDAPGAAAHRPPKPCDGAGGAYSHAHDAPTA
jgi:ATP-dependent DNA helicase RecQ